MYAGAIKEIDINFLVQSLQPILETLSSIGTVEDIKANGEAMIKIHNSINLLKKLNPATKKLYAANNIIAPDTKIIPIRSGVGIFPGT
jgi:hypothetical protein